MERTADQYAFPRDAHTDGASQRGLTKREEFAKAALQGLLAHYGTARDRRDIEGEAVDSADRLIEALAWKKG